MRNLVWKMLFTSSIRFISLKKIYHSFTFENERGEYLKCEGWINQVNTPLCKTVYFPDRNIRYNVNMPTWSCGHHHLIVSNIRNYNSALLLVWGKLSKYIFFFKTGSPNRAVWLSALILFWETASLIHPYTEPSRHIWHSYQYSSRPGRWTDCRYRDSWSSSWCRPHHSCRY